MRRPLSLLLAVLLLAPVLAEAKGRRTRVGDEPAQWDYRWLDGAVFYEVFVRSFADSDGDGIGDLAGLIDRLDYLNDGDPETDHDLGVRGLWLMPIFPSPSYHGYDVTDYETIEPDYGTLADFERLIEEADRRGIRVVLDLVINHTSSEHPWFRDATDSGRFRNWYVWRDRNPGWAPPWGGNGRTWHRNRTDGTFYYGIFWRGMPDLNFRTPRVRKEIHRLARLWLERGAAGFRLDASRYLVEEGPGPGQADAERTHAFWQEFAQRIRQRFPEALLVGENWADAHTIASYYGDTTRIAGGDELPMSFNFPLAAAIIEGVRRGRATPIQRALGDVARFYPEGARDAPFLTNHDQRRVASVLGPGSPELRLAASVLLTLPGTPFLYYGEEIGLENDAGDDDRAKRTPMPWDDSAGGGFTDGTPWRGFAPGRPRANVAAMIDRPGSLLDHYRSLIHARDASPALAGGDLQLPGGSPASLLLLRRSVAEEVVIVGVNLGDRFELATLNEPGRPVELIYRDGGGGPVSGSPGRWTLPLAPGGTAIWRFEPH